MSTNIDVMDPVKKNLQVPNLNNCNWPDMSFIKINTVMNCFKGGKAGGNTSWSDQMTAKVKGQEEPYAKIGPFRTFFK